jgi:predicted transcriptional regulator
MLILAENKRSEPPTAGSLARSVGTHRSQVDLIVKALHERGLISKKAAPGYQGAQHNTILGIAPDAIRAFQKAHLAQTGKRLDLEE